MIEPTIQEIEDENSGSKKGSPENHTLVRSLTFTSEHHKELKSDEENEIFIDEDLCLGLDEFNEQMGTIDNVFGRDSIGYENQSIENVFGQKQEKDFIFKEE